MAKLYCMSPQDFIQQYEKALASQQWENVAPLIHEQACVTFSNGDVHKGKHAIEKAFRRNFQLIQNELYSISDIEWIEQTEAYAVYTFSYQWSGMYEGNLIGGSGKGSCVLKCDTHGWVMLLEHLTKC